MSRAIQARSSGLKQPLRLNEHYRLQIEGKGIPVIRYATRDEISFHPAQYVRCNNNTFETEIMCPITIAGAQLAVALRVSLPVTQETVRALSSDCTWQFVLKDDTVILRKTNTDSVYQLIMTVLLP